MNDHAMFAAALAEAGRPDIAATIDTRRAACVSVGRVIEQFPDDASVEVIVRAGWLVAQRSWDDLDGSVWALGFDAALVADARTDKGNLFSLNKILQLFDRQHKYLSPALYSAAILRRSARRAGIAW